MGRYGRNGGIQDFAQGFAGTFGAFQKVADIVRENGVRNALASVDGDFSQRETPAASGEAALAAGVAARDAALSKATTDEDRQAITAAYQPTLDALEANRSTPAKVLRSIGVGQNFRQQDSDFTSDEISGGKARARADIYQSVGQEKSAALALDNEARRRGLSDAEVIRAAFSDRAPSSLLASGPTDMADVVTGAQPPNSAVSTIQRVGVAKPIQDDLARPATNAYLQRKVPEIVTTYLRQGRIAEAEKFQNFVDSKDGQEYTNRWARGARKLAIGDYGGALNDWQSLYNEDLYDDGRTVHLESLDDGKQVKATFFDQTGNQIHSMTQPMDAFARQAGMALSPERLVAFRAQQEAKRDAEAAVLDRQKQIEQMREDDRDVRQQRTIDARGSSNGLTIPQRRTNDSIIAARQTLNGLTQEDVLHRTQSTTSTGRVNDEYDPQLARTVKLANTRLYGDDPAHDQFTQAIAQRNSGGRQESGPSLPSGLPAGAKQIGTSGGKPVFQLPDGRRVVQE